MQLKDLFLVDATLQEKIVIVLITAVTVFIFAPREKPVIDDTPIVGQEFEEYPLLAWKSTHKKWNGKFTECTYTRGRNWNTYLEGRLKRVY